MTRPASSPPAAFTAAATVLFAGYFGLLHWLVVSGTRPLLAFALVCAPWAFAGASLLRAAVARALPSPRTGALALLAIVVILAAAVATVPTADMARLAMIVASHVDLLLLAENTAFLLALAGVFAVSLLAPREAIVTRLARIVRAGDMPPAVVRYTRRVTAVWAAFFASAALVSGVLYATASRDLWSAFVNLLLWPLVGAVFLLEYAVRVRVLRDVDHSAMLDGVHAFRRHARATGPVPCDSRGGPP